MQNIFNEKASSRIISLENLFLKFFLFIINNGKKNLGVHNDEYRGIKNRKKSYGRSK